MNTSTGVYTIPVSGIYEISATGTVFSTVNGSGANIGLIVADETATGWIAQDSANSNYRSMTVSTIKRMNAGQTVFLTVGSPVAYTVVCNGSNTNMLSIKRIGS
jgi:hypothetical protein